MNTALKTTPKGAPRGRPFVKNDPRRCVKPPGRPVLAKTVPDLLRWAGALKAPEKLIADMRKAFELPDGMPLTVDQATILRSRLEALRGNVAHLQIWIDRTEGKAVDRVSVEGSVLTVVETIIDAPGVTVDV